MSAASTPAFKDCRYDAFGRVVRAVDGAGRATTTAYPDNGRSIETTSTPCKRVTRRDHDAFGRAQRITNALGQRRPMPMTMRRAVSPSPRREGRQATTVQTRHGETLSVTDARGGVTRYAYNRTAEPITVTDALAQLVTETEYDKNGRMAATKDARGTETRFSYDQRNRVIERQVDAAGLNLRTLFAFDALGQCQITVTEGAGSEAERLTAYTYDRKGRATRIVVDPTPTGPQLCTTTAYDGLDNPVSVARGTTANSTGMSRCRRSTT